MHPASTSHSLLLFVPVWLVIFAVIGVIAVSRIRTVMRWHFRAVADCFLCITYLLGSLLLRARYGSLLRVTDRTPQYYFLVSIDLTQPCLHRQGFFLNLFFHHLSFIYETHISSSRTYI